MSDAIEAAARALYRIECEIGGIPEKWHLLSPETQMLFVVQARAAIEAYEAATWLSIKGASREK